MTNVLQFDFVFFKNSLFIVNQTVNGIDVVSYSLSTKQKFTSEQTVKQSACQQLISSVSCAAEKNILHLADLLNGTAIHERYVLTYDYDIKQYRPVFKDKPPIDPANETKLPILALCLHNDGSRIYMISSFEKTL